MPTDPTPLTVMPSLTAFVRCDVATLPAGASCGLPASHSWRVTCPVPGHRWHPTCPGHVGMIAAHVNAHDGPWPCEQHRDPLPEPIITWRTL